MGRRGMIDLSLTPKPLARCAQGANGSVPLNHFSVTVEEKQEISIYMQCSLRTLSPPSLENILLGGEVTQTEILIL